MYFTVIIITISLIIMLQKRILNDKSIKNELENGKVAAEHLKKQKHQQADFAADITGMGGFY
ncbi:MAG TPA: hypothetical protein VGT41_01385 [Candidatus Babeliales bacterium]|nr:hypothetical protein [Candidatus Babeliales bacterium]